MHRRSARTAVPLFVSPISFPAARSAQPLDGRVLLFISNNVGSRTVHQRYMPAMAKWMIKTAPAGADTKSWVY